MFVDEEGKRESEYDETFLCLPADAFSSKGAHERKIVAEAVTLGVDVVTSYNYRAIDAEPIETWRNVVTGAAIQVLSLRETVERIAGEGGRDPAKLALETICKATVSTTPRSAKEDKWSIERFIENLERGEESERARRRERTSVLAKDALKRLNRDTFEALLCQVRTDLPARARDTELRYHQRMRGSVRNTGYDPRSR